VGNYPGNQNPYHHPNLVPNLCLVLICYTYFYLLPQLVHHG
jgi:hypothetical protein